MWFARTFGFDEAEVRARVRVDAEAGELRAGDRSWHCGRFEVVTASALTPADRGQTTVREVVADVGELHRRPESAGALFQVASQVNALEMVSPSVVPEAGIDGYENDHTQGPTCAMACGAGTLWRAYFWDGRGQSATHQLNLVGGLPPMTVRNGYVLPTAAELAAARVPGLTDLVGVGAMLDTEVTSAVTRHRIDQVYCSAAPMAYSDRSVHQWEPVARAMLDASYDLTLGIAASRGCPTVYLTRLGGGVFGNPPAWIDAAVERAVERHARSGLDAVLVSRG